MMTNLNHNFVSDRMARTMTTLIPSIAIVVIVALMGCQESQSPTSATSSASETELPTSDDDDKIDDEAKEKAIAAKDALFARLSGRLTEVISSDGAAAAIGVCSREARVIAAKVGEEHGVTIGRTSFKLRNEENEPPDWARSLVEERVDEPKFVSLSNGSTGAFLPIRLKDKCLACHGPAESIAADIQEKLSEFYPDDQATGFAEGDLRGWFWVEVPSTESHGDQLRDDKEGEATSEPSESAQN